MNCDCAKKTLESSSSAAGLRSKALLAAWVDRGSPEATPRHTGCILDAPEAALPPFAELMDSKM
jgi:hypothetical protein